MAAIAVNGRIGDSATVNAVAERRRSRRGPTPEMRAQGHPLHAEWCDFTVEAC